MFLSICCLSPHILLLTFGGRGPILPGKRAMCHVPANNLIAIGFFTLYMGFRTHRDKPATDITTIVPLLILVILFAAVFTYLTYGW